MHHRLHHHHLHRHVISAVCVMLVAGCTGNHPNLPLAPSKPAQLIMSEGGSTNGGLSIFHGNVVVKQGQPGIAMAAVAKPGHSKEIAYALIFNHDGPNTSVKSESGISDATGNTTHTMTCDGNDCNAAYHVTLSEDGKDVATESITIAGKPYDPTQGRLFLIDIESRPPTVTQMDLELPADIPDLKETEATEAFGEETLNGLRHADTNVDAFCARMDGKARE